ncbi:MAG: molybdopterin-dependent oxidoreductase [Rhodospirillaceae bacterium]|jgi:anaerobic selenocysteine-containing dehydrogenase|nr:molybdopterin-dependent oxidoreductase [Rhodospirillaceae bacterium]MBT5566405.1 molybdopterin-dependent oxidoreductase [Rhodospirillaceae bacterium]
MSEPTKQIKFEDDTWTPSVCMGCYNCCGIKIHRVEDKIVDVIGDPAAPNSRGYICAKGKARFLDLYDPKRLTQPLKRGNPKKGLGEDPEWQEISWDEALETVATRLKLVREDDPRKLVLAHFDMPGYGISKAFGAAFGTPNLHWNRADYCGAAPHMAHLLLNGSFNGELDFERCNYIVLWGTQLGALAETIPLHTADMMADARARGAKLVVIDPFCSNAAAKAEDWIPIKPGTDGALALSMLNVLLNELGLYDVPFLKEKTNAPYLIGADGHYVRHESSNKPLVWDSIDHTAKAFDDPSLKDVALDGEVTIGGAPAQPSFQKVKEHLKQFDVEAASRVTTVPAEKIRSLTEEFAKAAMIGATVNIDGHDLPLRPAAIHFKRGSGAHKGGAHTTLAIHMLNLMVGNLDVPGGQRGVNPIGPFWAPEQDDDGMLVPAQHIAKYHKPYPPRQPKIPETLDLNELFPSALFTRGMFAWGIRDPEHFGIDYTPEILLHGRTNLMMNSHNPEAMSEVLAKIPLQVSFSTFIDETTEFADIVLPDSHDFERWDLFPANDPYAFIAPGPGEWYWLMRQQAIAPPDGARPWTEVYLDLAERAGFIDELFAHGKTMWNIDERHALEKGKRHTVKDIAERQAKSLIGDDFSFDQLTESSCMITREKTIEEAYPRPFMKARVPVYLEHLIDTGEQVGQVVEELGIEWDLRPYNPLLQYFPCHAHSEPDADFDLHVVNFKVPFITFSVTSENLWIDEISQANPYTHNVMINTKTAKAKGLKDGDRIRISSHHADGEGTVKVTELIHPSCIGIPSTLGHWARAYSVSKYKGTGFNNFLPAPDVAYIDTLSGQTDSCVCVKVEKLSPAKRTQP